MNWGSLIFGTLLGVVVAFTLNQVMRWIERRRRIKGNWEALKAEITVCGTSAGTYVTAGIGAPSYRLPTLAFRTCFASLLADAAVSEEEASELIDFYGEVDALNRGLDQADTAMRARDQNAVQVEFNRNTLKANRIKPDGGKYLAAIKRCEQHVLRSRPNRSLPTP